MKASVRFGLLALFLLAYIPRTYADRPDIRIEKGAPASGIKTTTRVFRENGLDNNQMSICWESSRTVLYDDDRSEHWSYDETGKTTYHKLIDANHLVRQFTSFGKDGKTVLLHLIRDRNFRASVYVNVDASEDININVGDELFLFGLNDANSGRRTDSVALNKHPSLTANAQPKPAALPKQAQLVGGFDCTGLGKGKITVNTLIRGQGGPDQKHKCDLNVISKPSIATDCGIEGTALASPTAPVVRPGMVNERPVGLAIIIVKDTTTGQEVARTTCDASGKFELPLPAGKYIIDAEDPAAKGGFPRPRRQTITVISKNWLNVKVHFDTGIR